MDSIYAVPGAVALVEWLLAAVLYALGWDRRKYGLNRVGDGLTVAGLVTALAGVLWLAWDVSAEWVLTPSSLATGWAVSTLAIYMLLARRRMERLSALVVLGFVILIQSYALGRLWWGIESPPSGVFLPLWMAFHTLTGLVGYGGLAVGTLMIASSFAWTRMRAKLPVDFLAAAAGLATLEWRSFQVALVALSASLSVGLIRLWWGLGQVIVGGFTWVLITWLLLVAGVYGLVQGAVPRRPARVILVLACVAAVVAVVKMQAC